MTREEILHHLMRRWSAPLWFWILVAVALGWHFWGVLGELIVVIAGALVIRAVRPSAEDQNSGA